MQKSLENVKIGEKNLPKKAAEEADALIEMGKRKGEGENELEETAGVVDMDSYNKWRRLQQLPLLNEERRVLASDGQFVDFGWVQPYFDKKIAHLPEAERNHLDKRKDTYNKMHFTVINLKHKAYGKNFRSVNKAKNKGKFSKEIGFLKTKQTILIELFGKMFSTEEVHKVIVEEWNFPCSHGDVVEFKRRHLTIINEKVEKHKAEYSDLRLVHKRSRLEELTSLYNHMKDKLKVTKNREDIKTMLAIMAEVRKEVEGEHIRISGGLDLKIEADINLHLQKEVFKEFSLTQIIIGRVASRMNMNSARLIQGLQTSMWSKFNKGLGQEPEDVDYEEIVYPSQMGYDFDNIEKKYKENEGIEQAFRGSIKDVEERSTVISVQEGIKAALMAKIASKTGSVKADKLRIEQEGLKKISAEEKKSRLKD